MDDLLLSASAKAAVSGSSGNTDEQINRVKRVVAGSESCRGAEDAKLLLTAMGLLPDPESKPITHRMSFS